ncbi:aminomethyl-transferring glycine dehydrogenase [Microbacterium sp. STN6]|uniref:aminomethyl-transferring glycine dehydrogenase n=1 Tax=Microbacterium sp. STN6 TaxID=2995588 RepID=UPI003A598998
MLAALGHTSIDELMRAALPASIRTSDPAGRGGRDVAVSRPPLPEPDSAGRGGRDAAVSRPLLPEPATEIEALAELRAIASANTPRRSMIGLGYYGTITPAVIRRDVLQNPSWYTAYTPYQPEISQGRLEALLNFQTMVADLTALDIANASMLDEATAVAEGMLLARRASKSASNRFLVDADALPQTKAVLRTRAEAVGIELIEIDFAPAQGGLRSRVAASRNPIPDAGGPRSREAASRNPTPESLIPDCFGLFIQYPGASGRVWNPAEIIAAAHEQKALAVVAADLLALTLLTPPGELGADIAVGTTQRFGVPMAFGGPHAGYMAVRSGLERQLPGRLVGVSQDADGHRAYRLTLQTREQHIRREKATSNICTAQVLLAVMAAMYAVYHGPLSLANIARDVHGAAAFAARALRARGLNVLSENYFDTLAVRVLDARACAFRARELGILINVVDDTTVTVSFDEVSAADPAVVSDLVTALAPDATIEPIPLDDPAIFSPASGSPAAWSAVAPHSFHDFPRELERTSVFLTHPVFNTHHSETSMMRYLKRLADKDYALDRGMIPLGSCTMKLNAAAEMEAITWPEFADIHPFAPADDVRGYLELIAQLEGWLAEVTGYDAVSLQPNAGSQGELAGLLAIRGYHRSRGDEGRTVCLIPSSAHGTNAASAVLAGMRVVVVACDDLGNVDLDDLRARIAQHADELAALMVTYPSTHGVYEHEIRSITDAVHAAGGQVYVDGANLNALLGYARFGDFGGDVSHLNLHKTFCIPHGGGGPGVGPVAAKSHLAEFLPSHAGRGAALGGVSRPTESSAGRGAAVGGVSRPTPRISAAPFGSPGILPISWAYVRMMGAEGLTQATGAAVLAANYIAARLRDHFPVLYAGESGLVAHECILDLRPLTQATGITVDDVAKRLIDYGFHAPTMSFPVPGTLMVEPTESEDLPELDRFIDAMIAIKAEADAVHAGRWPAGDNPLVGAPHTAQCAIRSDWNHAYTREQAVYPAGVPAAKYWPPVRRIDQAWGDRNLFCACPPPEAFEHAG